MVFSNFVMQALQEQTVGQEYAVAALTRAVTLAMAGMRRRGGVPGVLLFTGPANAGKTHMSRMLARVLTGSEHTMTCINCGQIDQSDPPGSLERLLVSGYSQTQVPFAAATPAFHVIAFEEIDKAPPSFSR